MRLINDVLSDCGVSSAEPAAPLPGLRVGLPANWWADIDAGARAVLDAALDALRARGVTFVDLDAAPLMAWYHDNLPDSLLYAAEMPSVLALYLAHNNYSTSLSELVVRVATPSTRAWLAGFVHGQEAPSPAVYADALASRVPRLRALWAALFDGGGGVDVIALPTTPVPARPIADVEPMIDLNGERLFFYDVQGRAFMADCVAGVPGISLPAGTTAPGGRYAPMPVGLMLQARRGADARLLAVAEAVEAALPPAAAAPLVPACAGCTPRLGFVPVRYPPGIVRVTGSTASMAYSPDAYALGFDGDCELKRSLGDRLPLVSPFAVAGAPVDWGRRAGGPLEHPPAGRRPPCNDGPGEEGAAAAPLGGGSHSEL